MKNRKRLLLLVTGALALTGFLFYFIYLPLKANKTASFQEWFQLWMGGTPEIILGFLRDKDASPAIAVIYGLKAGCYVWLFMTVVFLLIMGKRLHFRKKTPASSSLLEAGALARAILENARVLNRRHNTQQTQRLCKVMEIVCERLEAEQGRCGDSDAAIRCVNEIVEKINLLHEQLQDAAGTTPEKAAQCRQMAEDILTLLKRNSYSARQS